MGQSGLIARGDMYTNATMHSHVALMADDSVQSVLAVDPDLLERRLSPEPVVVMTRFWPLLFLCRTIRFFTCRRCTDAPTFLVSTSGSPAGRTSRQYALDLADGQGRWRWCHEGCHVEVERKRDLVI